jgi:hypothetical protein
MRLQSWMRMKKHYRTPNVTVGTVQKSMAAIPFDVAQKRQPALGRFWRRGLYRLKMPVIRVRRSCI